MAAILLHAVVMLQDRACSTVYAGLDPTYAVLAAGESAANGAGPASYAGGNTDFYTAEEMTQFIKPKRKKLKRKLRAKPADEEPKAQLSAADIAALEAAATAAATGDHGSRSGRGAEVAAKEAQQRLADLKARQERCDVRCMPSSKQAGQAGHAVRGVHVATHWCARVHMRHVTAPRDCSL